MSTQENSNISTKMNTKKKTIIITSIVVISFIIIGVVYAFFSDYQKLINKFTVGTVKIEDLNLHLKNDKNKDVNIMSPADIDTLSWTTSNIGTAGVLTRHTLEIYWEDNVNEPNKQLIYLFPANITREAIEADYTKGEDSSYMLKTKDVSKEINGVTMYGIQYQFVGDTLDGTQMKNVSSEVNQNLASEGVDAGVIDTEISTDDTETTKDEIAYRVLMNPTLSYLYQSTKLSIKVTTEAMQYTEDGKATWRVVDIQEL